MNLLLRAVPCLLLISAWATSATTARAISPELQEAFGWLDSAGIPSAKGLQPVEAWTGGYSESGGVKTAITLPTFLVSQQEHSFTIQTLWGERMMFQKKDESGNSHGAQFFEPRSFEWLIKGQLESAGRSSTALSAGPMPADLLQLIMLARLCRDFEAPELLAKVETRIVDHSENELKYQKNTTSRKQLWKERTADYLLQRGLQFFGSPAVPLEKIRQGLEHVAKILPDASSSAKARQVANHLTSLIEEERSTPVLSHADILKLPLEKQAAEQLRRLRVETMDGPQTVSALINLGTVAVPVLITAVDDPRPSRKIHYIGYKGWDHNARLFSIGELALRALESITGRSFWRIPGAANVFTAQTPAPSQRRLEIEAWWAEYQSKGERRLLIDAVSAGGVDMNQQARLLMAKYPEDVGTAFVNGFAKLQTSHDRLSMLGIPNLIKDPQIITLLQRQLREGEALAHRVASAYALREMEQPGCTEAMLKEWDQMVGQEHREGTSRLIEYLASSPEAPVVKHLTKGMWHRSHWARVSVAQALTSIYQKPPGNNRQPTPPDIRALIEKTLVSLLRDDEESKWAYVSGNRGFCVGDLAASCLTRILPGEYTFDGQAGFKDRENERKKLALQWHTKTGTPWIAPPARPQLPDARRNEVVSVRFANGLLAGTATEKMLLALKDKPLNPDSFVALMCDFAKSPPAGVNGLRLRLVRTDEPSGMHLTVWSHPGKPLETFQTASFSGVVLLNQQQANFGGSASPPPKIGDAARWEKFRSDLIKALSARPDSELVVKADVTESQAAW